jgi:hypothetical protein
LQETFAPIFDDRDGREDGGKKHDQDKRARIEIFEVTHSVRRGTDPKRGTNAGADDEPENERRQQGTNDPVALPIEAHDLPLPEGRSG